MQDTNLLSEEVPVEAKITKKDRNKDSEGTLKSLEPIATVNIKFSPTASIINIRPHSKAYLPQFL